MEQLPLGRKIKLLSTALAQEMNRSFAAFGLTASQALFLGHLAFHQDAPVYPRDLERAFDFTHPTVSGILGRMEAKGFITFRKGENDRRCKQILLTDKALQCHSAILRHIAITETTATDGMSADEIGELNRLLDKMIANMGAAGCCTGKEETHD